MNELTISGYASRFGEQDLGGDIVRRGAFAASLLSPLQINTAVEIEASLELGSSPWVSGATPTVPRPPAYSGPASLLAFDLPDRDGVTVGAVLSPFIPVEIAADNKSARLPRSIHIGATLTPLLRETPLIWDRRTVLDIQIKGLSLASLDESEVLSAGNRFAVETPTGWEVFACAKAELIGPSTYRLSNLLRGLSGSEVWMADEVPAGARILWLGHGSADVDHLQSLELDDDWRGEVVTVTGQSGGRESISAEIEWTDAAGVPLSPAHPRIQDDRLSWIPRHRAFTGWTEDVSAERFRITRTVGGSEETFDTAETAIPVDGADRIEVQTLSADGRLSPPLIVSL